MAGAFASLVEFRLDIFAVEGVCVVGGGSSEDSADKCTEDEQWVQWSDDEKERCNETNQEGNVFFCVRRGGTSVVKDTIYGFLFMIIISRRLVGGWHSKSGAGGIAIGSGSMEDGG